MADGARSQLGRRLGRTWHRSTAYGVAARAYIKSHRSDDSWISSHLELRGTEGELLSGYGWVFPLGDGEVNVGVGTLATDKRPADVNLRSLIAHYAESRREHVASFEGDVRAPSSALLPMGGAVSGVAGPPTGCSSATPPAASTRSTARASTTAWRPGAWLAAECSPTRCERHPRLLASVAAAPAAPLRHGVLHRPPAGRSAHRARGLLPTLGPVGMRSRRAHDAGPAGDGQPGPARGHRPRWPGCGGRPGARACASTTARRSADVANRCTLPVASW